MNESPASQGKEKKPCHRGGGEHSDSVTPNPFHESLSDIEMSSQRGARKPHKQAKYTRSHKSLSHNERDCEHASERNRERDVKTDAHRVLGNKITCLLASALASDQQ